MQLENTEGTLNEILSENVMARKTPEEDEFKMLNAKNNQQCEDKQIQPKTLKRMNEDDQQWHCSNQNTKLQKIMNEPEFV